jgi:hypothetical protein
VHADADELGPLLVDTDDDDEQVEVAAPAVAGNAATDATAASVTSAFFMG